MIEQLFDDKRAAKLLARVREDISSLRQDVKGLVRHTTQHTLPEGARELARSGRESLLSGRDYAVGRARDLRRSAREHPAGFSLGGLLLLGAVVFGTYLLIKGDCCQAAEEEGADDSADE